MPDPAALGAAQDAAAKLARLRRVVVLVVLATLVLSAVLVAIHPQWALGVPVLVGGVVFALRPTYQKWRSRAVASLPGTIQLAAD